MGRVRVRVAWIVGVMGIGLAAIPAARAQQEPSKKAADHATVEKEGARGRATPPVAAGRITWPGMTRDGTVLLPNGWSLKPAGRQTRLGDFPVQIAVHPDRADPGRPPRRLRRARGRDGRRRGRARSSAASPCPRRSPAWPGRPTASSSSSAAGSTT